MIVGDELLGPDDDSFALIDDTPNTWCGAEVGIVLPPRAPRRRGTIGPMRVHDRYDLGAPIGSGSFGTTLAAVDTRSGEPVVIKRLPIENLPDWKALEHFEREANVLRAIAHRGVPRFIDAFEAEHEGKPAFFIVAERIDGETLAEKIERGARWSTQQARTLFVTLLETLDHLHGLSPRVIHRDIKPGNIVVRDDGVPVLVDFGAVRDAASTEPGGGPTIVGTAGYMPPEQAMGMADPRSDLYALAATMLHVLTHRHPSDLPRDGLRLRVRDLAGIDEHFTRILERMLEPEPDQRFASARAVLEALEDPSRVDPPPPRPSLVLHESSEKALAIPAAPRPLTPAVLARLDFTRAAQTIDRRKLIGFSSGMAMLVVVSAMARMIWLIPLAMIFMTLGFFVFPLRGRELSRTLYRGGEVARARIVDARQHGGSLHVRYRFEVDGTSHSGMLSTNDALVTGSFGPQAAIVVFYDANEPARHFAMLESEVRALQEGTNEPR